MNRQTAADDALRITEAVEAIERALTRLAEAPATVDAALAAVVGATAVATARIGTALARLLAHEAGMHLPPQHPAGRPVDPEHGGLPGFLARFTWPGDRPRP